jgi:hypothetical protein
MSEPVTILYRPVGRKELELIRDSGFRAFPPRLPGQPFFYPVLNEDYAVQIARDWNTKDEASGYEGYVLKFEIRTEFLSRYEVHVAIDAVPVSLPAPSLFGSGGLWLYVVGDLLSGKNLLATWTTGRVSSGEDASARAKSQMRLHLRRYFGLRAFNAFRPPLVPAGKNGRRAALAAVGIRAVAESIMEDFDRECLPAMLA